MRFIIRVIIRDTMRVTSYKGSTGKCNWSLLGSNPWLCQKHGRGEPATKENVQLVVQPGP